MNKVSVSAAVRGILLAAVGTGCLVSSALAADAPQEDTAGAVSKKTAEPKTNDGLEEIVISGYARSLADAIQNKRAADVISDGISAEDIGKYPEQNVAESLQRVTGVQLTRNLGDGQYISVRGLDPKFTDVLYNGRQIPSGSGTRAFDFQVLSANFAHRVDVYKTPTPDMLESGLAATVNVQSIEPFSAGGSRRALTTEGVYDEQARGGFQPHISGLLTDVYFGNRLGWTISVDYSKRNADDQQSGSDGVVPDGTYAGPGTAYRLFSLHTNDLVGTDRRLSAMNVLQFKVNDAVELKLDTIASRFEQKYNYYQGESFYPGAGALGPSPTDTQTLDSNGVETKWSGSNVFAWLQANRFEYEQKTMSTALSAKVSLEHWKLTGELSYGEAREDTTQLYVSWYTHSPGANLWYDTTRDPGGPTSYGFYNGFDPNNIQNYNFFGVQGAYKEPTTDKIWDLKLGGIRPVDGRLVKAIRVGGDIEDRTLANSPNWISNTNAGFAADMSPYLFINNNPTFFSSYSGGAQVPKNWLTVNLDKFFSDYPIASFVANNPPAAAITRTTVVEERSAAAYLRVDLASDDSRWKGNAGVRLVRTEELSSGYVPTPSAYLIYGAFGGASSLSYSAAAIQAQSNTYIDALPSFNISYQFNNQLVARFAAARVMQRPDMNLLAAASSPNAASGPPPSGTWTGTLSKGNPNLKPYRATQVDLSLEWYFGSRGLLAANAFLKRVENLVLTTYHSETDNVTLAGNLTNTNYQVGTVLPITFSVAQPTNAQSTTLKGLEFGYQQPFDFLPGGLRWLGAQANFTHIWADDIVVNVGQPALPVTGVSKNSYNLGLYFDNGTMDVHAVYNYRSDWVYDPLSYFGDGIFVKSYGQLDLSANAKLSKNVSLNASVYNLTQEALIQVDRYGVNRLYDLSGRRYYAGVRINF